MEKFKAPDPIDDELHCNYLRRVTESFETWVNDNGGRRETPDFLQTLRVINADRYQAWAGSSEVDVLFSGVELGEEAGEVLGKIKKLERERRGWRGSRATVEDLADEIGDAIIVLDRIAGAYGIDVRKAVADKFNKTSAANDFPHRLPVWPPQ